MVVEDDEGDSVTSTVGVEDGGGRLSGDGETARGTSETVEDVELAEPRLAAKRGLNDSSFFTGSSPALLGGDDDNDPVGGTGSGGGAPDDPSLFVVEDLRFLLLLLLDLDLDRLFLAGEGAR